MKFAILAPGNIARAMAKTVAGLNEIERYAVASRDINRAKAFAMEYGFEKAYGSYEEMLQDEAVELVYVASPHSHHYEHAKLCLEHGKNVLLEKAFTVNAAEAKKLSQMAQEKKLLLAEAIWTRYMPSRRLIDEIIESSIIGEVTSLTANLGYPLSNVERMQNPALAGGALLDLGVYPINFALMAIHERVEKINSTCVISPRGVDWANSITLTFPSKKVAVLHSNMRSATDRRGMIYGEKGFLEIQNINNCEKITAYDNERNLIKTYSVPEQLTGYEYEVSACVKAIREGETQCPQMPLSETIYVMELMDSIRAQWQA